MQGETELSENKGKEVLIASDMVIQVVNIVHSCLKGALHGSTHHSFQDAKVSQTHVCLRFMSVKT